MMDGMKQRQKRHLSLQTSLTIALIVVGVVVGGTVSALLYNSFQNQLLEDLKSRLESIATIVSLQIDGDAHAALVVSDNTQNEIFQKLQEDLFRIIETEPELIYIYSMRRAEDGTIYFGVMGPGNDKGRVYAVNPDGTEKWYYDTGYWITSDPVIGDDGTVYIGSTDTYFYALNPDGTLKWKFKTGDYIKGPASIANDGTVYVGSWDDYLYALYPDNGTMIWRSKVAGGTETNPSIANDGTIYVGCDRLYAIYPNGTKRWTFNLGTNRYIHKSSPAISADGTIYVGTNIGEVSGGEIIAVNPNGTEKWRKKISIDGWIDSSPAIGEDGTVYIGSATGHGGYLHAFGPVESNSPPEIPTISGKTDGEFGKQYQYIFRAVDPDNNPITFYIDWGDGTEGWKDERASDVKCYYRHTWDSKGDYTIRAKAKDVLGEESDWAYLEVTMPHTYNSFWWLNGLLDRFPILQRLLEVLIR